MSDIDVSKTKVPYVQRASKKMLIVFIADGLIYQECRMTLSKKSCLKVDINFIILLQF
jgi:hypothetical protein